MAQESIEKYLRGAACPEDVCSLVCALERTGHEREALPQLAQHRLQLLESARETDRRLDCLDRVIRTISQKESNHS